MNDTTSVQSLISRLAAIPTLIAQATEALSETGIHAHPEQGEWSISDVFAHMRAVDDLWIPRIYGIIVRDQPILTAFDERRWAELVGYTSADFRSSLSLYTLRRAELVQVLRRLELDDWERIGLHEEYGSISLFDLMAGWVKHEEEHYAQLAAVDIMQR